MSLIIAIVVASIGLLCLAYTIGMIRANKTDNKEISELYYLVGQLDEAVSRSQFKGRELNEDVRFLYILTRSRHLIDNLCEQRSCRE